MRWLLIFLLLLAGCTGDTVRTVVCVPVRKEPTYFNSAYYNIVVESPTGEQWVLEEYSRDAIRVVPGVPVSVQEFVDSDGRVLHRRLAQRIE